MSDLIENETDHCDQVVNDYTAPNVLRWFIFIQRLPAVLKCLAREMGTDPVLFAKYKGKPVRVTMASRLGDVGINYDLTTERGYDERVLVSQLTDFTDSIDKKV